MSKSRPPSQRRSSARRNQGPLSGATRAQVVFAIVSSLVICAMIGGVFVSLSFGDVFGDLFADDTADRENFVDPNSDIISAQETIVAENPDNLEDLLLLANLLGNSSRLGDAIPLYERALAMSPDDIEARVSFARALADGEMQADAELQFQRALELDAESQPAHYYLAELYINWSPARTAEALVHYQRAAEIDSGTLIGERSQTQLDTMGAGTLAATPDSAGSTPVEATP
ncbi:MAG: tetratricopeptide repeat protein [Chloroflexota bacterium]|nr:tetratricopeptide repeat protein [Chloroflexota bacterium]